MQMKTKSYFLNLLLSAGLLLLFGISQSGCTPEADNGELDGMWKLRTIAYQTGEQVSCEDLYYIISHRLIELAWSYEDKRPGQEMTYYLGRFQHKGDSLYIYDFRHYKHEENKVSVEELNRFGLQYEETGFRITTLNSSHMTLQAPHATLYFRKF